MLIILLEPVGLDSWNVIH